ncbi:MAG: hypothetical protein EPO22_06920, partial [Dehalococcoidia bacterium]
MSLTTAVALAVIFVASDADVDRLGFLLWFRHEGRGVGADGLALLSLFGLGLALTFGMFADGGRERWLAVAADAVVKLSLLAGVAFMLANPDLPQLQNKSLPLRAAFYPLLTFAIPAVYAVRGRRGPYPTVVDASWSFALTIDIVGNDLHWYGNFRHWDDVVHCLNAIPLMVALSALLLGMERNGSVRLGFWGIALAALTAFTALHSLWETSEYLMDRLFGTVLQPGGMDEATRNHLWSLAGALGGVALLWSWRHAGRLDDAL